MGGWFVCAKREVVSGDKDKGQQAAKDATWVSPNLSICLPDLGSRGRGRGGSPVRLRRGRGVQVVAWRVR